MKKQFHLTLESFAYSRQYCNALHTSSFFTSEAQRILLHSIDQKSTLMQKIDQVTEEIQNKRAQLNVTRQELRELSIQEGSLKTKRDDANTKCSEIRKKLYASREALQQIQKLYGKRPKSIQKEVIAES